MELDHPSCYGPKGFFEARGEWEASPDVTIHLKSYGYGNGIFIKWDHEVESVELYEGTEPVATAYESQGVKWGEEATDLSEQSLNWMLAIAYAWTKQADDWADKNAEPAH